MVNLLFFFAQVRLRTEVPSTPSSTRPGLELMTARSWQYISCHWDACSNHSAISASYLIHNTKSSITFIQHATDYIIPVASYSIILTYHNTFLASCLHIVANFVSFRASIIHIQSFSHFFVIPYSQSYTWLPLLWVWMSFAVSWKVGIHVSLALYS